MKKLLLFVLIAGAAFTASAQRNQSNDNNYGYSRNNDRNHGRHPEMDRRIQAINNEYDAKINQVSHSFLRERVKQRRIAKLEHERFAAIERCKTIADAHSRDYANGHYHDDNRR